MLNRFLEGTGEIGKKKLRKQDQKAVSEAAGGIDLEKTHVSVVTTDSQMQDERYRAMEQQVEDLKAQIPLCLPARDEVGV